MNDLLLLGGLIFFIATRKKKSKKTDENPLTTPGITDHLKPERLPSGVRLEDLKIPEDVALTKM